MLIVLAIFKRREVWTSNLPLNIIVENSSLYQFLSLFNLPPPSPRPNIKLDLVYNKTGSHFRLYFFLIYIFVVFCSGHPLLGLQTYF